MTTAELPHAVVCPTCLAAPTVQVVICPTCGEPRTPVVWVGATARYGDHPRPGTEQRCDVVGGGVSNYNLAQARPLEENPVMIDFQTAALCAADPLAQQLRGLLHRLDREAEQHGWAPERGPAPETSRVTLYILEADRERRHLSHKRAEHYTACLRHLLDQTEGDMAQAMLALARGTELTRDMVTELGLPSVTDAIRSDLGDNWDFYGLAFGMEGWSTRAYPDSAEAEAALRREIHLLPGRVEVRLLVAFARDGFLWHYVRARGEPEAELIARNAGQPGRVSGGIPHALARMVNAIVAQQDRRPVPGLPPRDRAVEPHPIPWVAPNTARESS